MNEVKQRERTGMSCSFEFRDVVLDLSRNAGLSVMDYCDRHILPGLLPQWKTLQDRKAADYAAVVPAETGNPVA
jgi:hypothetical protein